jgi:hypothetical protein
MPQFQEDPPTDRGKSFMRGDCWIDDNNRSRVKVIGGFKLDENDSKVPHGIGTAASVIRTKYTYSGTFVDGRMHGYGKLQYMLNGDYYEGEFKDGLMHG